MVIVPRAVEKKTNDIKKASQPAQEDVVEETKDTFMHPIQEES